MKTNKHITSYLFLLASSFAFALAMQAHAMSYAELFTMEYDGDEDPSTATCANYTAYYCTKAAAQTMFGADTISGIETYLTGNFAKGKSAMGTTAGSYALTQGDYNVDQYQFVSHCATAISSGDYFAVAFYQDDAFRVFASADVDSGNLRFDDSDTVMTSAGEWKTVPEPTSGLLLLLGMAGLALRRKRA